jgi:6-methylpretetramide 4-monooxygenase
VYIFTKRTLINFIFTQLSQIAFTKQRQKTKGRENEKMSTDFIIVGGGIGGAVLAELLGRGGKKVVVLEKSIAPPNWNRPEILWPATIEVLFSLLPKKTWEKEAVLPMQGVELHNGQRKFSFVTPEVIQKAQVQPWFTNPNQTREQLLGLGSFELRRGVEVTTVLKEQNRIVGVRTRNILTSEECEVLADCTIGDDGVNSIVRKACDIEIKTQLFPLDFLCYEFDWPSTLKLATARIWLNSKIRSSGIFALAAMPLANGKGVGLVPVQPKIFDNIPATQEAWKQLCAVDPVIKEIIKDRQFPQDFVRIRRPWGHASRYGTKGAILMGDAAHPVSPAGGQGANMSVADACVLAEIALSNQPRLLEEYERRRRPANERSMSPTRGAAFIFGLPDWCFPGSMFFSVLPWVRHYPSLLSYFLRSVSTTFLEKRQ